MVVQWHVKRVVHVTALIYYCCTKSTRSWGRWCWPNKLGSRYSSIEWSTMVLLARDKSGVYLFTDLQKNIRAKYQTSWCTRKRKYEQHCSAIRIRVAPCFQHLICRFLHKIGRLVSTRLLLTCFFSNLVCTIKRTKIKHELGTMNKNAIFLGWKPPFTDFLRHECLFGCQNFTTLNFRPTLTKKFVRRAFGSFATKCDLASTSVLPHQSWSHSCTSCWLRYSE